MANAQKYVLRSEDVVRKNEERKKWREENAHLALPFFVKELRSHIPPVFPGELALVGAASGEGKSYSMSVWHSQAQQSLEDSKRRAVTAYISQEETTERLISMGLEKNGRLKTSSQQTLWIGASWGMSSQDMEDMHMTNIVKYLEYGQEQMFKEIMPYYAIFYDYVQATPADPHRKGIMTEELRRLQVGDDTRRLFDAAKTFKAPIIAGAQTSLKRLIAPYNAKMLIPSQRDLEEGAKIFQVPDYVYTLWLARNTHAVGTRVEIDGWSFEVEKNLVFMWFLKARGHSPETARGISRVFPLKIKNGEYVYDPDYHNHIYLKPVQQTMEMK